MLQLDWGTHPARGGSGVWKGGRVIRVGTSSSRTRGKRKTVGLELVVSDRFEIHTAQMQVQDFTVIRVSPIVYKDRGTILRRDICIW